MSLHSSDRVILNKDITRIEGPYANKGMTGTVLEVFKTNQSGSPSKSNLHVKVLSDVDGKIYTFRMTSLDKLED